MALPEIAPTAPSETFARINTAIRTINNLVASMIDSAAYAEATRGSLDGQIRLVAEHAITLANLTRNSDALASGLGRLEIEVEQNAAAAADSLSAAVADLTLTLGQRIATQRLQFVSPASRPGDSPERFAVAANRALLAGAGGALPLLPSALLNVGDSGSTVRIEGSSIIASRLAVPIEEARVYSARFVVQRRANPSDPSNDSVVLGIVWLDANLRILAPTNDVTILEDMQDLSTSYGRQERAVVFSRSPSIDAQIRAPMRARYARAYVQTYGPDGITDVEVLGIEDVSAATVLAPETADTVQRVGALDSLNIGPRLTTLEAQANAPNSVTFATKSDAASGEIPTTVTTVALRGLSQAGDGGDGIYKRISGTAPAGSDSFINQGVTFVRVYTSADVLGALLLSLPTSLPSVPGKAWLNGGILAVS